MHALLRIENRWALFNGLMRWQGPYRLGWIADAPSVARDAPQAVGTIVQFADR